MILSLIIPLVYIAFIVSFANPHFQEQQLHFYPVFLYHLRTRRSSSSSDTSQAVRMSANYFKE